MLDRLLGKGAGQPVFWCAGLAQCRDLLVVVASFGAGVDAQVDGVVLAHWLRVGVSTLRYSEVDTDGLIQLSRVLPGVQPAGDRVWVERLVGASSGKKPAGVAGSSQCAGHRTGQELRISRRSPATGRNPVLREPGPRVGLSS